jgi:putative cardiolipin synthase
MHVFRILKTRQARQLLAALLVLSTTSSAFSAQTCEGFLESSTTKALHILQVDETDAALARDRSSIFKLAAERLLSKEAKADPTSPNSEGVQKLKTLMARRDFATWFRFSDEISRGLDKPAVELNALVKPIITRQEGLLAKLMMANQAQYTIDLTYYIFNIDDSGLALVDALKKAVERGVNIRVMVDSLGSASATLKGNPHFRALLEHAAKHAGYVTDPDTGLRTNIRAKVEVVVFNPVSNLPAWFRSKTIEIVNALGSAISPDKFRPLATTRWNPNRRSHDKIMLIDAQFPELCVGITGGANVANVYTGLDPGQENYRDIEVLARNDPEQARMMPRHMSIGEVLSQQFDRLYFHSANRNIVRGILSLIFGQKKHIAKLEAATKNVEALTADTAKALGEDPQSPDFGKKYLHEGFLDAQTHLITSTYNLIRSSEEMSEAIEAAVKVEGYEELVREARMAPDKQSFLTQIVLLAAEEQEEITVITPYIHLTPKDVQFIYGWLSKNPKRRFNLYTNSIVTSDNMPAQTLVDVQTIPNLLKDPRFTPQLGIYEYGKLDDANLGGTVHYGKLHFKGAYFKSLNTSIVATYNKDPRSQLLNSEMGLVIRSAGYAVNMQREITDIHAHSHAWGSPEYYAIRSSPQLPKMKQAVIKNQTKLNQLMMTLHLWWLI